MSISADSFAEHIKSKDMTSVDKRARFLYGNLFTYDTALPDRWLKHFSKVVDVPRSEVKSQFVWIYPHKSIFGQAAPLTLDACKLLALYELMRGDNE
ncbi:MAG: hypothetical protein ACTSX2_00015 [Candidatus Thorarchaeota archaeon]